MNYREATDRIINTLRVNNVDQHISRRYVLSILKNITNQIISQKLLDRTIGLEMNLYSEISCIEMERIEVIKCPIIEFRQCKIVMRSKKPLPKSIWSRNGSSTKEVTSIDGVFSLTIQSPEQIRRNKNRQYKIKGDVYCYEDGQGYLWILDEEIYAVRVLKITPETEKIEGCNGENKCKSLWDYEYICPDKILDSVFKDTVQTLLSTYKAIQPDQNPNGNEGN